MVDAVIRLFPSNANTFDSNGIGYLPDIITGSVTEERNGSFELTMTYPITGRRYSDITLRSILVAKPNPYSKPQAFRIYNITKPIKGIVTIYAEHISYDVSGFPVRPFSDNNVVTALDGLRLNSAVPCPFTFWTDKTTVANFKIEAPVSMRSILGGVDGSILDVYGGEYEFDNYEIKLYKNRGENRGVTIRYGKNLTDIDQEENCANVYTGVYPYWKSEEEPLVESNPRIIKAPGTFDFQRILLLDCSMDFVEQPTPATLKSVAESYINNNDISTPKVSLNVSFVDLASSGEYEMIKKLEQVRLCDTLTVEFPALGVSATAKCNKTVYDIINDVYTSLSLGDARSNLASTIVNNNVIINNNLSNAYANVRTVISLENGLIRADIRNESEKLSTAIEQTDEHIRADLAKEVTRIDKDISDTNDRLVETAVNLNNQIEITAEGLSEIITKEVTRIDKDISDTNDSISDTNKTLSETKEFLQNEIEITAEGLSETITKEVTRIDDDIATLEEYAETLIDATAEGIMASVSKTYETKDDAGSSYTNLNSYYTQLAGQIVMKVDANGNVVQVALSSDPKNGSKFEVKAKNISMTADEVINLMSGGTLNLGAKNIKITSENFQLDEKGNMKCTSIEALELKGQAVSQFNSAIMNSETWKRMEEIVAILDGRLSDAEALLTNNKVLFDLLDASNYFWNTSGGGSAPYSLTAYGGLENYVNVDTTGYRYLIVRCKGTIDGTPSGATGNWAYLGLTFSNDPSTNNSDTPVVNVVNKHTSSLDGDQGLSGSAYNKWYNAYIDISALTGVQTLKCYIYNSFLTNGGGTLWCSKMTLTNTPPS